MTSEAASPPPMINKIVQTKCPPNYFAAPRPPKSLAMTTLVSDLIY